MSTFEDTTINENAVSAIEDRAQQNGLTVGEQGSTVGFTSSDPKSPVTAINELKKKWTTTNAQDVINKMGTAISSMETIIGKMRETSNKMSEYSVEIEIRPETETRGC